MKYDFTSIIDRKGKDALAVDALGLMPPMSPMPPKEGFDVIPMWVADMNFPALPAITEAIKARADHPAFGYFIPSDEYYSSIINWHKKIHGITGLNKTHIGYENGVLGGLVSTLKVLANPGDRILLHSPTYVGFTGSITKAGYRIELSPLKQDEQGVWRMDYEDMDRRLKKYHIHAAVFCSPHNPCGRVWEKWEIEKAMEVYKDNDCLVISDEIWSDLIMEGHKHIPTQSVGEDAKNRTVALYAPSKTFNLAGLIGSYHIIYNDYLRQRIQDAGESTHYNSMNVLSMHALIGAYSDEGMLWVRELNSVLGENIDLAYEYFMGINGVGLFKPEGTYMLFIDFKNWLDDQGKSLDELLSSGWDVGVAWQDGRPFHGEYSIRMNLALPRERVKEALSRLSQHVFY